MSERLHVRKINKIEHGIGHFGGLNYPNNGINALLLCDDIFGDSTWESEDGDALEIPRKDLLSGIDKLGAMTDEEFNERFPDFAEYGYTKEQVCTCLREYADESDQDFEKVYLEWF